MLGRLFKYRWASLALKEGALSKKFTNWMKLLSSYISLCLPCIKYYAKNIPIKYFSCLTTWESGHKLRTKSQKCVQKTFLRIIEYEEVVKREEEDGIMFQAF